MYGILYLPTFNHKNQPDAGKYTSRMDPMRQFQQIPPATKNAEGGGCLGKDSAHLLLSVFHLVLARKDRDGLDMKQKL